MSEYSCAKFFRRVEAVRLILARDHRSATHRISYDRLSEKCSLAFAGTRTTITEPFTVKGANCTIVRCRRDAETVRDLRNADVGTSHGKPRGIAPEKSESS